MKCESEFKRENFRNMNYELIKMMKLRAVNTHNKGIINRSVGIFLCMSQSVNPDTYKTCSYILTPQCLFDVCCKFPPLAHNRQNTQSHEEKNATYKTRPKYIKQQSESTLILSLVTVIITNRPVLRNIKPNRQKLTLDQDQYAWCRMTAYSRYRSRKIFWINSIEDLQEK